MFYVLGHLYPAAQVDGSVLLEQWFGNMVTMKWWNDLWLKEGFSSYMSYLAVDDAEPTFQIVSSD